MKGMVENNVIAPAHSAARAMPRVEPGATPPVIILGGGANALSVARSIGRIGAAVYALNEPNAFVQHSRFCRQINVPLRTGEDRGAAWTKFLLGTQSSHLWGAILLACGDEGIQLILKHRNTLSERFILDESNPIAQEKMLGKISTYEAAVKAGVPTPKYWIAESRTELEAIRGEFSYPMIVKPCLSHVFEGKSGKKLTVAQRFEDVVSAVAEIAAAGTQSLLVEMIPGPDDRLCSYFTYLDEASQPLFHFTKRIIRRYPVLMGTACYHITDRIPEAVELGNRLFAAVGLRGLANVEFKRDVRDGKLKLIECNARFTASDCLVARSGFDLPAFVYHRLTGRPQPEMKWRRVGMRLWDPVRDFQACMALRKRGEMSFGRWMASVLHRQTFPYLEWSDPLPAIGRLTLPLRKRIGLAK